ncbi:glycoside hydrolase family 2 TIM barrel-domain containing protein [Zunongwangia sp. H14]|uniref:glycoside hydrolase family 2 TIM barrel-domain containing protein n=1 Tax=Zunongwangia sp. H14 TaxID=3240792 RepID=UPI003563EC5B
MACKDDDENSEHPPNVYIQETAKGYELIRNGKPFFIKGGAGAGFLEQLKDAGGNTIRVYDTIGLKAILDQAENLDLAVVVDIPLPTFEENKKYWNGDLKKVKQRIKTTVSRYKDHPALLYWNLGNEIGYPEGYKNSQFFKKFNGIIEVVHSYDPNHPVSTAIVAGSRKTILSISFRSPELDFISLNAFGSLSGLEPMLQSISLLWDGPYVISEWGLNGPWEAKKTSWGAPVEQTSTKKAELLKGRYHSGAINNEACLGSFYFYWGIKQERTITWFSLFNQDSSRSQVYHSLENLWTDKHNKYPGPEIEYALLNGEGALKSNILIAGDTAKADLILQQNVDSLNIHWEIRKEAWNNIFVQRPVIKNLIMNKYGNKATFQVPFEEGPYRLFVYIKDRYNNFATTNIPFYVVRDEKNEIQP